LWPGGAANAVVTATAWIKNCYPAVRVTKPWDPLTASCKGGEGADDGETARWLHQGAREEGYKPL